MIGRISNWINTVNTTNLRIIVSAMGAVINVTAIIVAMMIFRWVPTPTQMKVLTGCAGVLLTMMGFDVLQFASKRFSDAGYQAAKSGAAAGSSVEVAATPPAPTVKVDAAPAAEIVQK
jgi:hypothetical protein